MVLHRLESGEPVIVKSADIESVAPYAGVPADRPAHRNGWSEIYFVARPIKRLAVRESYNEIFKKWDVPMVNIGEVHYVT